MRWDEITFEEKAGHVKEKENNQKNVKAVEQNFGERREVPVLGEKGVCEAAVVQTLSVQ